MSGLVPPGMVPLEVPIDIDRVDAQRRALVELAKAKYGGTPEFFERAVRWLLEWLARIDQWLAGFGGVPGTGLNAGFVVAVVVLLAAIAIVIWRVGWPKWQRRRRPSEALHLDSSRPAVDYRVRADAAAAAGDWPSAVRDRFRALVRELEVRTVLDVRPARTAWEAARSALRLLPASQADLFAGAEMFSAVNYGDGPADARSYARMVEIDERVTAAADTVDLTEEPASAGSRSPVGW